MSVRVSLLALVLALFCALVLAYDPLEGCQREIQNDPGDEFFALMCRAEGPCSDDDDDDNNDATAADRGRAIGFYCDPTPVPSPPPAKPKGLRGRGPARIQPVSLEPAIPCNTAKLPRGQRTGMDTPGASPLWCPSAGRKTYLRFEGEVLRQAGGGVNITVALNMVGDLTRPALEGEELAAALDHNVCLRDTYCRVPLHTPPTLTIVLDEARAYWPLQPAVNHVAYAGRLEDPTVLTPPDAGQKHPSRAPYNALRTQLPAAAVAALVNTTDTASFLVDAGPMGDCMGRRRRDLGLQSVIDAEAVAHEALLHAEAICDFQWADSLAGQAARSSIPTDQGCMAALCLGPGENATSLVRYAEYGNHCTLWEPAGEAEAVFAVTVTVARLSPSEGGYQPTTTLVSTRDAVPFAVPIPDQATAYTVARGHGATNTFWQEGAKRSGGRATIRARVRFGDDFTAPADQIAPAGTAPRSRAAGRRLESVFAPSLATLNGGILVCGNVHMQVLPRTTDSPWLALDRLHSAASYWATMRAIGADVPETQRGPTTPPAVPSANVTALAPFGGPLTVPTTMGHGGAQAAWSWVSFANASLATFGRRLGMMGQTRSSVFLHSLGRLDEVCAVGTNRSLAAAFQPANAAFAATLPADTPLPAQPCERSASLNTHAHHQATVEWVRGYAPAGVSREDYGALPRSPYLPAESLWDEGAASPGLYPTRVHGTAGGHAHGGGQRLPFGLIHEETRVGSGPEELSMRRHGVDLRVEVDDAWLHIDNADHFSKRATGTVYALRLLRAGSPGGYGSQCVRQSPSSGGDEANPFVGEGFIRLAFATAGDTPVRVENMTDHRPLRKRYRAELECDPSVGRFAVAGSRVDVDPGGYRATVRFMAAVGGPAGTVTVLDHYIKLTPPHAPLLADYLTASGQEMPSIPRSSSRQPTTLATGTCRVKLFSDEAESSHVQLASAEEAEAGFAAILPCAWQPAPTHRTAGNGPVVVMVEPDTTEANAYIGDAVVVGITFFVGAAAILLVVVVLFVAKKIELRHKQKQVAHGLDDFAQDQTTQQPQQPARIDDMLAQIDAGQS